MEKINIYKIFGLLLLLVCIAPACKDEFLEKPPKDSIVDANFFNNDDQILAATSLLYSRVWFEYNDKASYAIGDYRGGTVLRYYNDRDMVQFNTTGVTAHNLASWSSFYVVVGQSNTVIQNINRYASSSVTPEIKAMAIAEARFMRAMAYYHLVMNWGAVPIIENNFSLLDDPAIRRNTVESVWQFITNDFRAAVKDLPISPIAEGRLTTWSAEAALARTYLTRAGVGAEGGTKITVFLDSAKYYSQRVIEMSGNSLLPKYEDLFKFPYDNNKESLFSLQWVYTGPNDWGSQNSVPAYIAYSADIANGDGWGGDHSATYYLLSLYDGFVETDVAGNKKMLEGKTKDERLHTTFMMPGSRYPEITQTVTKDGEKTYQELEYPFSDDDNNFVAIKKYVTGQAVDVGGQASQQHYGHDTYMIRLAEMYLIYAEAALGNSPSTSDAQAIEYFNAVHMRAGLPAITGSLDFTTIFDERMIEFAMEYMAWYDIVRWHYYAPQAAYDFVSNQDRGFIKVTPNKMPDPTSWTIEQAGDGARKFTANSGNFLIPLPASELSVAPNLALDPVDYFAGQ